MDFTITGTITAVQGPTPVIDRKTNQPTGATELTFRVEESGEQYPDSVILRIYEKDGGNSRLSKAFETYPGFQGAVQVGMYGTFHSHPRGSMGVSQATGRPYAINDAFMCWKVEAPQAAQPAQNYAQPVAQQPAYSQPAGQFAQPAQGYNQPSYPGMSPQGFPASGWNPQR